MELKIFLLLVFLVIFAITDIESRKTFGSRLSSGSRSWGRSRTSGGRVSKPSSTGSSSGGRHTSSNTGHTSFGGTTHTSSGGIGHTSFGGTGHTSFGGTSHTSSTNGGHISSLPSTNWGNTKPTGGHGTNTQHQQNKDINHDFLQAEGGGATRPTGASGSRPSGIGWNDKPQSNIPSAPSAPPVLPESIQKSSIPQQNQGNSAHPPWGNPHVSGTSNTPWSNPHLGGSINPNTHPQPPNAGGASNPPWANPHLGGSTNPNTHPQPPNIGGTSNPPWANPHLSGSTNPNTHSQPPNLPNPQRPPYPLNPNHPMPNNQPATPIGWNPSGNPYPSNTIGHPSFPQPGGHPHLSNSVGHPYPSNPIGHPSFPHPVGNPYPSTPIGNPYTSHPVGHNYGMPTAPVYQQPHVFAQPAAQPYIPGQTVIMVPQERSGFGDMVKQALVFSAVHTITDRVLFPHHGSVVETRPQQPGATTNTVIYNQYFNGSAPISGTSQASPLPPGTPQYYPGGSTFVPPPIGGSTVPVSTPTGTYGTSNINPGITSNTNVPPASNVNVNNQGNGNVPKNISNTQSQYDMSGYSISDKELQMISEELFLKDEPNLSRYIKMDLQNRSSPNATDVAKRPLFYIVPEIYDIPTIYAVRALYDNYENNATVKENVTIEKRKEQNLLLDIFVNTNVMATAMNWLAKHSFIDPDDFERKEVLRNIWFTQFGGTTSGFERVFTSEIYSGVGILGIQDWLYFAYAESSKQIDYMGYVDKLDFGDRASLVKLNLKMNDIVRPNVTIFVGTTPELEMALYTICFYARPNNACPVSFGGKQFIIYTHSFRYYGKDVIDLAMPIFTNNS